MKNHGVRCVSSDISCILVTPISVDFITVVDFRDAKLRLAAKTPILKQKTEAIENGNISRFRSYKASYIR
jgi:hypothetical protein